MLTALPARIVTLPPVMVPAVGPDGRALRPAARAARSRATFGSGRAASTLPR